tara:strand:+ start:897 stop:1805 length:909 start_codon:yes stop_codon:yes gene_type:complete
MTATPSAAQAVPEGFAPFRRHGAFAAAMGPFYEQPLGDRRYRYGFLAEARHCNPQGTIHGGAMYSFADHMAGHAVVHATGRICATLKLKVEFMAAPPVGGWIEGRCEIYRTTRTLAFVRIRLSSGPRHVMTADGCFRLFGEIPLRRDTPGQAGEPMDELAPEPHPAPAIAEGYKAFSLQGEFAGIYGPMQYRREADGRFLCGLATHAGHDNSTGVVHGGVLFAFADDLMGRAVSATSRRYSSTIALDVSYLDAAPLGAWLEGRAEIQGLDDDLCFIRSTVSHDGRPLLSAAGVWRLFRRFDG